VTAARRIEDDVPIPNLWWDGPTEVLAAFLRGKCY
jgi:hypothetical protein